MEYGLAGAHASLRHLSSSSLRHACRIAALFFLGIALAFNANALQAASSHLFVLQGLNSPFDPTLLDKPYIDGMALQVGWRDVEVSQGSYDWRRLDRTVDEARRRGKKVTLHLLPLRPPEWLFAAGAEKYCFTMPTRAQFMSGRELCEVIPWDPVYLERWSRLVTEFGRHYGNDAAVLAVSVTAPAPEMVLPGGIPGSPTFRDLERRYSKPTYLAAWKRMIDIYQASFPSKPKFVAPGIVLFDEFFADDVVAYARERFGQDLWLFNAGLRADGVPQKTMGRGHIAALLEQHARTGTLGLQTIWSSTNDPGNRMRGALRETLEQGLHMGGRYFEVYAADVSNSALQSDLADFKRRLAAPVAR